jgi:Fur family ferric uptake transcriptional regulator
MTTKLRQDDLLAVIEDAGHRVTDARRSIVALLDGKGEGFSAEEINRGVKGVGRATVYRTLKLLLASGVLCKLISQTGSPRYAVSKFGHHHHAVCVRCGRVSEFRDSTVERLLKSIEQDINGSIVGHRLELFILCNVCLASDL